jgi:polar amino acid transport system substrate-binding protein
MQRKCASFMVAIFLFVLYSPTSKATEKLVFPLLQDSYDVIISAVILKYAYRKIGIDLSFKHYPPQRALLESNSGDMDGEIQRVDGLSKEYSNLIQIYPSINYIEAVAFGMDNKIAINGWESLRPYTIGIVRGIVFAEKHTGGMEVQVVNDYKQLMLILQAGRVNIILAPKINGLVEAYRANIPAINLQPPLEVIKLFHYLHRKNKNLVPKISEVLRVMEKNGNLKKIQDHVTMTALARAQQHLPVICGNDLKCYEEGLSVE